MRDLLWRVCEWRIRRLVPPWHAASTIGDLAEDYARVRAARGGAASALWLIRESASLTRAYGAGREARPLMLADDLRHAWRRLAARPAAALLCAALLSIGIGLATAMFSVVDALLLQPAPFANADRLVQQGLFRPEPGVMQAWRGSGLFDAVEAGRISNFQHDGGGAWPGALVTPGTFTMLGANPLLGRGLLDQDAHPGADGVIVVSETIWRSVFAGDPALVGRRITLNGTPQLVVGIMPDTFRFPAPETVIWGPFDPARAAPSPATIFGRLAAGVPLSTAAARAAAIARQTAYIPPRYSGTPPFRRIGAIDLGAFTRNAIWLLFAGVGLVFVVVCSNVGGLLLAHLASRRREFGTCAALGASRGRLVRQALAEHALVAAIGTAAGVGLAWILTARVPEFFVGRTLNVIDLDVRAMATASILGVASVLLSGLAPAWLGTRSDPVRALRQLSSTGTESRAARATTRSLLVAQIGLAVSLLIGAALLTRSFSNLVHADRGLNTEGVVRISLSGLDRAFTSPQAMALGTAAIEAQAVAWPEIRELALSREVPPSLSSTALVQGELQADEYRVGSTFFEFYDVPIHRGRAFAAGDAGLEVIVGERLARMIWPDADPLGRSLLIGRTPRTVIGVAGEIALPTVARDLDRPEFYVPLGNTSRTLFLNVRCRAACPDAGVIRSRLAAIHPALSARVVGPSEIEYLNHLKLPRAVAQVGGLFALVAVTAAAGGLFSVMAQVVGRRKREFGIRTALGASRRNVRRLVLADALPLIAAGLALGGAGGWLVARGLAAFNYGVTTFDPLAWAGVSATVGMTVLAAAWRPAREAMRVDPVTLLREE